MPASADAAGSAGPGPDGVDVPYGVRLAAAWSWRLLLIAALAALVMWLLATLSVVVVPVLVALLLTALLRPAANRLTAWRIPRTLATVLVVLAGILLVVGLITFVTRQVAHGFGDLATQFNASVRKLQTFITDLGISQSRLDQGINQLRQEFTSGGSSFSRGVLTATTTAGHVFAGFLIVVFATIFFVYDGRRIWSWLVRLLPVDAQERVDGAGLRAWAVLTAYTRATALVALVDAVGIGLVALLLGLPLVAPIAVLVFLSSFIPIVGALVSGAVAVGVALVSQGPLAAVLMLVGVLAVQQLEAHVLQPFLLGRMVQVHPLAVVLAIAIGSFVAGIVGALLAVPTAAVANTVGHYLTQTSPRRRRPAHSVPARAPAESGGAAPLASTD